MRHNVAPGIGAPSSPPLFPSHHYDSRDGADDPSAAGAPP